MDEEMLVLRKTCCDDEDHASPNGNARHLQSKRLMRKRKESRYQRQQTRRHLENLQKCIGLHNASWETTLATTITQIFHLMEFHKRSFTSAKLNTPGTHFGDDKNGQ